MNRWKKNYHLRCGSDWQSLKNTETTCDETKASLHKSEQRYSALFEEMHEAFYISSIDGSFGAVNQAALRVLGYDSKAKMFALGIHRDFYVNPKERQRVMEEIPKKGYEKDNEVHLRKKDGGLITALETCHKRFDAD